VSKPRSLKLALTASALTALLLPLTTGSARADAPPPSVQPPGVPFGLCSVVDAVASEQEHPCPEAKGDFGDDNKGDDNKGDDDKGYGDKGYGDDDKGYGDDDGPDVHHHGRHHHNHHDS
jgi:hypothetical protein